MKERAFKDQLKAILYGELRGVNLIEGSEMLSESNGDNYG